MSFQIKPNRKETENKTIRFPIPLIERIEIDFFMIKTKQKF